VDESCHTNIPFQTYFYYPRAIFCSSYDETPLNNGRYGYCMGELSVCKKTSRSKAEEKQHTPTYPCPGVV
jgi:hypothetical protein